MKKLLFATLAGLLLTVYVKAQQADYAIAAGPFKPTDESLKEYKYPEWFRDAKLGFWSHWGPQAVPRQGDWYAKNICGRRSGLQVPRFRSVKIPNMQKKVLLQFQC